jgi:amidophosphoribosyltransferase
MLSPPNSHHFADAAGMLTTSSRPMSRLELIKDNGLCKEVFQPDQMRKLVGNIGLGHVRYPTAGGKGLCAEAQPLFTNYPHGLAISHNGTLTNTEELRSILRKAHRHVNTGSDSEVLISQRNMIGFLWLWLFSSVY